MRSIDGIVCRAERIFHGKSAQRYPNDRVVRHIHILPAACARFVKASLVIDAWWFCPTTYHPL